MKKILFYYHHFGGLGHGMRIFSICKAIRSIDPKTMILVINSGAPQPELEIGKHARIINLPLLNSKDRHFSRKYILKRIVDSYRPDAAVFEHFPFGRQHLAKEIIHLIGLLKENGARIYSSARDIIVQKVDIKRLLRHIDLFSAILIHSDTSKGFITSFKQPIELVNKMAFTGRVCCLEKNELKDKGALRFRIGAGKKRIIIINTGGGIDGFDMLRKAVAAKPLIDDNILYLIATGPSISDDKFNFLKKISQQDDNIVLKKFVRDFTNYVYAADLYITMGGYNSINNILLTGTRSIVFPRKTDAEQVVRAAVYGDFFEVADTRTTPKKLADKIRACLNSKQKTMPSVQYSLAGAKKSAAFLISALSVNTLKIRLHTRCNANCDMCSWKKKTEKLSYQKILTLLDQASLLGIKNINFTGGEPSIYPGIKKVLEYAKHRGFYVSISTNGLWPRHLQKSIADKIDAADISIDAASEHINDRIRGKKGYLKAALGTLGYLLDRDKPVHVNVTVRPDNVKSLRYIIPILPRRTRSVSFTLVDHSSSKDHKFIFKPEGLLEYYLQEVPMIMRDAIARNIHVFFEPFYGDLTGLGPKEQLKRYTKNRDFYRKHLRSIFTQQTNGECQRQRHVLRVNSDGSISPCCFLDDIAKDLGNILKEGLIDIITSDRFLDFKNEQKQGAGICKNCMAAYGRYSKMKFS